MLVAGSAQSIIGEFKLRGMRVVTIAAANALTEHLALHVRTINVDLIHDLTVIMIGLRSQKFICIIIIEIVTRPKVSVHDTAPRVAGSTGLNLRLGTLSLELGQSVPVTPVPEK
jgi:hypothetical protein